LPYTTPPTFTAGTVLTAADLNILSDDIEYHNGLLDGISLSGAQVTRVANQSISTSTDTNISWDTENEDFGGWYSSGTAIVVPAGAIPAGITSIGIDAHCSAKFATDSAGKRRITLLKNGSSFGSKKRTAIDDDVTDMDLTEFTTAEAGDTFALQVWQNSGSSLNVTQAKLTILRRGTAS
jgi:hypothetical protein